MERLDDCMYRQICKYEHECSNTCRRYINTKHLLNMSNIAKNKQRVNELIPFKADVEAFKQLADIKNSIEDFVEDGRILYLWSNATGNGKTTWSIKMALQYINAVWQYFYESPAVIFISVPDFLYKSKCFNDDTLAKEATNLRKLATKAELVILDDIGLDYVSKYDYAAIFSLVDALSVEGKSMIVTGNYSPEELADMMGDRLPSRVCNDYVIELKGMDRRGDK